MTTIVTRAGKGSALTHNEVDANFTNLQTTADAAYAPSGTDVAVADGGTGSSTAAGARTNLGLVIGTDVQAQGATLSSLEGLSLVSGDILYATAADTLARLPKGTDGQFLRLDAGLPDWETLAGGGDALVANPLSQFAATTSLQLKGVISDETGSGALVFATSPALVTPDLGTPSAAVLTNATGLPLAAVLDSTTEALGVGSLEIGHASDTTLTRASAGVAAIEGANILVSGGALGTPASGTLTNATGLPIAGLVASTVTAIGVGSVELGHATDTTLTRASAGVLAVEGVNVLLNGGALGTPSSGTLTNATGLPVAGITASTSTALGVGSLEIGHATDTTLARVSAGVASIEGNTIVTNASLGLQSYWIPANGMNPRSTSPCGTGYNDSGTTDNTFYSMDFDTTTQEYATFVIAMPKQWDEGTVTFAPYWTNLGGASTETVVFSLSGRAVSNDDTIDATQGTVQTSSDTWLAQKDLHVGPTSSAITIAGTPAAEDLVVFEVSRVVASDNMTGDAKLLGVMLYITVNAWNDA